jgi:hypothetical protein
VHNRPTGRSASGLQSPGSAPTKKKKKKKKKRIIDNNNGFDNILLSELLL